MTEQVIDNPQAEEWEQSHPGCKWEKRKRNREWSTNYLKEHSVYFQIKNDGAHLIVTHKGRIVDFWPGTGYYKFRKDQKKGRGVKNLLKDLGVIV